ncbi:MAG: BamA/TamA family outer membrane protein [Proteobacteria bacterium]|nr:BamA/TamA family outer membrane protein [Pseudomonadota bacterium]MBU4298140.1 BamA/TamA family outer membrane protein [Pseudomonadota bacterium]MCG2749520.1 BamA/TamA family outer membrane protein [Desulfobulbaceae bacterium]
MKVGHFICLLAGFVGGLLWAFSPAALAADGIAPGAERPGENRPELPGFLPETPRPGVVLPPAPPSQPPIPPGGGPEFELSGVTFEGNTVFSDQELKSIAGPFLKHRVTFADLDELRYQLTRHYTDSGYVNSGVVLKPGQEIEDGMVTFQVLEGRLDEVRVSGARRLRPDYVRDRIWPDPARPFNTHSLQERFQLLLRDPLIERMNGELRPGTGPGEAVLNLDVIRARPWELSLNVDNHRPPSTGAERAYLAGVVRNLTGYGDALDFAIGVSDGAEEGSAAYSIPVTARDSRLLLRFDETDASVIEEPLENLDIESETRSLELGLVHPVYRSLRRTISLGAFLARRENETSLLDEPFSFSRGADDGETRVTVVRLSQEFIDRTYDQALALRSIFSFGINALDSTIHGDDRPDSQFVAWLGQTQYARRLSERGIRLILRGDLQLANDELLDLERFPVGGARTVRGYRENELVRDNGYAVSAELRYPLWTEAEDGAPRSLLEAAVFMDYGAAWNKGENQDHLHSVGFGLLWNLWSHGLRYYGEIYLAHDIKEAKPEQDHNLQDDGICFAFGVSL